MIARSPQALLQRARAATLEPIGTALDRPGARSRWALVLIAVLVLCSAPAVVSALPVSAPSRTVPQLLEGIRSSGSVPFTGSWCDGHYRRLALTHPAAPLGCLFWLAAVGGVVFLARWLVHG